MQPNTFTLYREGDFYRCYNADAMLFSLWVKPSSWRVEYDPSTGTEILLAEVSVAEVEEDGYTFEYIRKHLASSGWLDYENLLVFGLGKDLKESFHKWFRSVKNREKNQHEEKEAILKATCFSETVLLQGQNLLRRRLSVKLSKPAILS